MWEGEERSWECGGERWGEARLVVLYGDGGELREEAGEEAEEQGGEDEEETEEERLLTVRSTGSSWECVGLLGVWGCDQVLMW